jgi:hypothetical protein
VVAFNDGFHASHHQNSQRHWSDHPTASISVIPATFENVTFTGDMNFGDIWVLLMTKNYTYLEEHFVFTDIDNRPTKGEIIEELKRMVKPAETIKKQI